MVFSTAAVGLCCSINSDACSGLTWVMVAMAVPVQL